MWLWVSLLRLGRMFTRHVTTFLSVFTLYHWEQIVLSVQAPFLSQWSRYSGLLLHINGFIMIKYVAFKPVKIINGNTPWNRFLLDHDNFHIKLKYLLKSETKQAETIGTGWTDTRNRDRMMKEFPPNTATSVSQNKVLYILLISAD